MISEIILAYRAQLKKCYILKLCILALFIITTVRVSNASETLKNDNEYVFSIEYLHPTENDRDITTINLDFNYLISRINRLSMYIGIVGTYAYGSITQLEGDINQGTLREVHYDNSAFGLGPGILVSFEIIKFKKVSLHLNGNGNLILYSEKFPAGGDNYNFMWRGGPMLEYEIGKSQSVGINFHFVHVSNGQGLSQDNPSYNTQGVRLSFKSFF